MMLIFISGPHRGVHNPRVMFDSAAYRIWRLGAVPFNPIAAARAAASDYDDQYFIDRYCALIRGQCFDAMYMLLGWSESAGAVQEHAAACEARISVLYEGWSDNYIRAQAETKLQGAIIAQSTPKQDMLFAT